MVALPDIRTREFVVPALIPGSPDCTGCVERLTDGIASLYGVEEVAIDAHASTLSVSYDAELISEQHLEDAAAHAGVRIATDVEHQAYRVSGLDCPDCAASLDKSVANLAGVATATLNFASGLLLVEWDAGADPRAEVERTVRAMGYGIVRAEDEATAVQPGTFARNRLEILTTVAGVLMALGWLSARPGLDLPEWTSVVAYLAAIVAGGALTMRRAVTSVRTRTLDMNVLMTLAILGAIAIGEYAEGAMVFFLYSVGMLLEARSLARTRSSIRDLMDLAPPTVRVSRGGEEVEVAPSAVAVGETVVVRAGERIALDGRVDSGASAVDESPVTGESVPVEKRPGDPVYAGSLNTSGLLSVEVTAPAEESTLARIIHLVEEAQSRRAPSQRLVDRFTRYYTPAVVLLAALVAALPPLLGFALGIDTGSLEGWVYRGLVVLVVSCPCALVISTPVAIVSAISNATRQGVLIKGGLYLERAAAVRAVAVDKTGTLTLGRPEVVDVRPLDSLDRERILEVAAALEAGSTHPIARAIVEASGRHRDDAHLDSFHDLPGLGVRGIVDGEPYVFGSPQAVHDAGVSYHTFGDSVDVLEEAGLSPLVLASDRAALGVIGIADQIRPEAAGAVAELEGAGVEHVVMLTGDSEATAQAIAERAGVHEVRARLLPEDKVDFVRELRERHGVVAMVGDGVNDAPALAVADIGIAMGAVGSDTALETSDVALMRDDLSALPEFFRLGRRTVANITQNVVFSIVIKFVVLVLAMVGTATLWMAVFADTGVALLVILNGLRLLRR